MKVSFDGALKRINILSGEDQIDVKVDLYSDWKEWMTQGDNAKYLPAFRTIGGEPLGVGFSGDYYFLQNQLGWRIHPPEEDIAITFEGSLFPEDAAIDMFAEPVGNFTVSFKVYAGVLAQGAR